MTTPVKNFRRMNRYWLLLMLLGLLGFPQHASANMGTPLMWAGMFHLAIGNALIGLIEGTLLSRLFDVPKGKSVLVMIVANYFSAWLGGLFINGAIVQALPMDLSNGWIWFWVMVFVTYGMTLLLEWPFIAWCLRGKQEWFKRSIRATLITQSASYVAIFGWYWMASGTSLYTRMNIVKPSEMSLPESVAVYYISSSDGDVYKRNLVGGTEQKVYGLHSTNLDDRIIVRTSELDSTRWDLVARIETEDYREPQFIVVMTNIFVEATLDWMSMNSIPPSTNGTSGNFGYVQPLGSATNSQWKFWAGFYPAEGLRATFKPSGESMRFAYETPFGAWYVRNVVHLPTDKVLFQLGDNQICAFDPATRLVALLWHGKGPMPVIEKINPNTNASPSPAVH